MTNVTVCVTFIDPDGQRFDLVAIKPFSLVPRLRERISLGQTSWNVLEVRDVIHPIDGGKPVLTCVPISELDNNQKRRDILELLLSHGFQEVTGVGQLIDTLWSGRVGQNVEGTDPPTTNLEKTIAFNLRCPTPIPWE